MYHISQETINRVLKYISVTKSDFTFGEVHRLVEDLQNLEPVIEHKEKDEK